MEKYTFVDAQEMHKNHPNTFEAPTPEELEKLEAYDFVKVGAELLIKEQEKPTCERFWVEIQSIDGNTITGIINNELVLTHKHGLKCDQEITFEKKNVYNIFP